MHGSGMAWLGPLPRMCTPSRLVNRESGLKIEIIDFYLQLTFTVTRVTRKSVLNI